MTGKLRTTLVLGTAAGLITLLSACGHNASTAQSPPQASASQSPSGLLAGANDLSAPLDWSANGQSTTPPPLPACSPMVQRASATYRSAPSYAYGGTAPYSRGGRTYYPGSPGYYPGDPNYYDAAYDAAPPDGSYAWLGLAGAITGVIGDSPPDYAFDYDGVEPWVWQTGDRYVAYAEPIDDGFRYYYYAPGAAAPFLVRDPYYSYGYGSGGLAVIYDRDGRLVDMGRAAAQRAAAQQYWNRAAALRQAYMSGDRFGVPANLWAERRGLIARDRDQWIAARRQQVAWRSWDTQHAQAMQARWSAEAAARRYAAGRFDRWRSDGFRSQAPRFYAEAQRQQPVQLAAMHERALDAQFAERRQAFADKAPFAGRRDAMTTAAVGGAAVGGTLLARRAMLNDRSQAVAAQRQQRAAPLAQNQPRQGGFDRQRPAPRAAMEQQAPQRQAMSMRNQALMRERAAMAQRQANFAAQRRGAEMRAQAQGRNREAALAHHDVPTRAGAMRAREMQARARADNGRQREAMMVRANVSRDQAMARSNTMRAGAMHRQEAMRVSAMRQQVQAQARVNVDRPRPESAHREPARPQPERRVAAADRR